MTITVFGANGKVGRLLVTEAIDRGFKVIAFIHASYDLPKNANLIVVQGDVHNYVQVEKVITDSDAVFSTLGSWGTTNKDILSTGMKNISTAMKKHGIKRIISLTGAGCRVPGFKEGFIQLLNRIPPSLFGRKVLRDAEEHIRILQNSNLDWTVLRSPIMNNLGNSNKYIVSRSCPFPNATVNRKSVAKAMLDVLENKTFIQESPFIRRVG